MAVVNVEWPRTSSRDASIGGQSGVSSSTHCMPCAHHATGRRYLIAVGFEKEVSGALGCSDSSNKGGIRTRGGDSNSDRLCSTGGDHSGVRLVQGAAYPGDGTRSGCRGSFNRRGLVWRRFEDARGLARGRGRWVPGTKILDGIGLVCVHWGLSSAVMGKAQGVIRRRRGIFAFAGSFLWIWVSGCGLSRQCLAGRPQFVSQPSAEVARHCVSLSLLGAWIEVGEGASRCCWPKQRGGLEL